MKIFFGNCWSFICKHFWEYLDQFWHQFYVLHTAVTLHGDSTVLPRRSNISQIVMGSLRKMTIFGMMEMPLASFSRQSHNCGLTAIIAMQLRRSYDDLAAISASLWRVYCAHGYATARSLRSHSDYTRAYFIVFLQLLQINIFSSRTKIIIYHINVITKSPRTPTVYFPQEYFIGKSRTKHL